MTEEPAQTDDAQGGVDSGAQEEQSTGWKGSLSVVLRERAFFYVMVLLLIVLTLILVWPFISAILLGLAAVVITHPIYDWFLEKKWMRGKKQWAVILTIVSSILVIAIPVTLFLVIAFNQARAMFNGLTTASGALSLESLQQSITSLINQLSTQGAAVLSRAEHLEWRQGMSDSVTVWLGDVIIAVGQSIPSIVISSVIALAIMMVLLPAYRQPNRGSLSEIIPFPPSITSLYLDKVQMMIRAMFLGTFVISFAQGAAMGIVYWIAGVPNAVFLALLSMVLALLPVIGISLVAWPVVILLFLIGNMWQAIFVIVMLVVVVGNIDTILRPMLVPKEAYLNPALTLLAIFGGLQLLGLVGALYGPVIMILLVTSVEVYTKYILRNDLEPYLDEEGVLSLEKLGLRSEEGGTGKEPSGLAGMASRALGRLWSPADNNNSGNYSG
jgi:predicted PurR-regulated permease PerM